MSIPQSDLARRLGVSTATICRAVRTLGRRAEQMHDSALLELLVAGEMVAMGIKWELAAKVVAQFAVEIRYLSMDADRRSWLVFIDGREASFRAHAVSPAHLTAILDSRPLSRVLPIHLCVACALEELAELTRQRAVAA